MELNAGNVVLITNVDHNGFCGRDYHPGDEDINTVAEVISVTRFSEPDENEEEFSYIIVKALTYGQETKFLELVDYEVEVMEPCVAMLFISAA